MKRSAFLAAAVVLAVGPAFAANDGTLSATSSTGTFDVYATVTAPSNPSGVKVSGVSDINFGQITGTNVATSSVAQFCLYHSSTTASFALVQQWMATGSAMRLTSGQNGAVWMPIQFTVSHPGNPDIVVNTNRGAFTGLVFNRQSQGCSTGSRTTISAQLQPSNGTGADLYAGYSGSFQMIITPE